MLRENIKDAGIILQNVLTHPLSVPGNPQDTEVSLLSAAEEFEPAYSKDSNLSKILSSFLKYPNPTRTLLIELDLLCEDLKL